MKPLREAAVGCVLRTPFLKPGNFLSEIPQAELIRLVMGELLFSSEVEPSLIDTVVLASASPFERSVPREVRSFCKALSFDRHLRIISLCSGVSSDLTAIVEASMRVATGESEAAVVVGIGAGKGHFRQESPDMSNFPAPEVTELYPSTFEEREAYMKSSVGKALMALKEGNRSGMRQIALPPFFEDVIDRDDIVDMKNPGDPGTGSRPDSHLPVVLIRDFFAPRREGLGALLVMTRDMAKAKADGEAFVISGFKHLGVPVHLRGTGAAVALEALLTEKQLSVDNIDVLEIMETTSAQVISSLKLLRSRREPRLHPSTGDGDCEGTSDSKEEIPVNLSGGSLACGSVSSCSGIRMLAGLTELLGKKKGHLGAVMCEDSGDEALALLIERI